MLPVKEVDCLIVGGGPAGLSAALILGRCRRKVLVCDAGKPRNAFHDDEIPFMCDNLRFFGGAAGWGLGERFMISGAAGAQRTRNTTRGAYGGRAAMGVWTSAGGSANCPSTRCSR